MEKLFDISLQNRKVFHYFLKTLPKTQLLQIPEGYRNNIWWNIAHVVVTQQLLVYTFSGLEPLVPQALIAKFKKGTIPDGSATDLEIEWVDKLLFDTLSGTQEDYLKGNFITYNEYTTSNKVTLHTVEDAITFNVFHEGLHMGAILALQKMVVPKD